MNKAERVNAVLAGQQPDRPPYSFWHHFTPQQSTGQAAVDAHLRHFEKFDLDFLKVMNDHEYPRANGWVLENVKDLKSFVEYSGEEEGFGGQLDVIRRLRERLGRDVLFCSTIFNPWTILRKMTVPPSAKHGTAVLDVGNDPRDLKLRELVTADENAVATALLVIAKSLANFARLCIEAGADGIFLSVREDWVTVAGDEGSYARIVRASDYLIAEGAKNGTFNMLHVCGKPQNLLSFADYPFQVLNWADRAAGPAIGEVVNQVKPAICGGLDNLGTLASGTAKECETELLDALIQAGKRPIMISPGCTYDPTLVKDENIFAVCQLIRNL